ncbi:MAG: hypothetical protein Ta2A_01660 [Treponemataceae bacterium]|nr:MAG: hypothetical protein Ta2A_01660 [Treponemataceae bacterium]
MNKLIFRSVFTICAVLAFSFGAVGLSAQEIIRDYVCIVRQEFHPDVISYLEKIKDFYQKRGETNSVKAIDTFMKGLSGSGFVYVDASGRNYIVTNNHVVDKAHKISLEFEKNIDGDIEKTVYDNIEIIATDDDIDLAILAFPRGRQPFTTGLALSEKTVVDGDEVFSAGFPGTIDEMIWQFGNGRISNALVKLPAIDENDKAVGPYVQHNAPIDPGNSGGPLLMATVGVPTGYAVIGVNTLSIRNRQAANYAIPAKRVREFLQTAFTAQSEAAAKAKFDTRIDEFVKGLSAQKALYPHIARYLSYAYVAPLAEYSISEVYDKASYDTKNMIFSQSFLTGMDYAAAWVCESEMRKNAKTGALHPTLGEVKKNADGSYTAQLKFGERTVDTTWAQEYGMWRIKSFAGLSDGKKLFAEKEKKAADQSKLKTDYTLSLYAGLASMGKAGSTLDAALGIAFSKTSLFGVHVLYNKTYTITELNTGFQFAVRVGSAVAIIPFGHLGLGIAFHEATGDALMQNRTLGFSANAGLMVTTKYVTGLFMKGAYQFNGYGLLEKANNLPDVRHTVSVGLGYMF